MRQLSFLILFSLLLIKAAAFFGCLPTNGSCFLVSKFGAALKAEQKPCFSAGAKGKANTSPGRPAARGVGKAVARKSKLKGSIGSRDSSRPRNTSTETWSTRASAAGEAPWVLPDLNLGPSGTRPKLGVSIAAATSSTSSASLSGAPRCINNELQRLLKGRNPSKRLHPSFLGSLLLTLRPNSPSQQQPQLSEQKRLAECLATETNISRTPSKQKPDLLTAEENLEFVNPRFDDEAASELAAVENEADICSAAAATRFTLREELLDALLQRMLQQHRLPEIAVAGRSNVGKSSLLNAFFRLCGNSGSPAKMPHARSSRTPGRTQAVDIFLFSFASSALGKQQQRHLQRQQLLQHGAFVAADLPGYGHTEGVPPEKARRISRTLEVYIQRKKEQQRQLNRVLLLVDGRRGMGPHDAALLRLLLRVQVETTLVVTKEDEIDAKQMIDLVQDLSEYKHLVLPPHLLQLRMQLLQQQQQLTQSTSSDNAISSMLPTTQLEQSPVSTLLSKASSEALPQEQQKQQHRSKQQVPVFVVSARSGSGVKQLWQHLLRSVAQPSEKERPSSRENKRPRPISTQKAKSTVSKNMHLVRAEPSELPDELF